MGRKEMKEWKDRKARMDGKERKRRKEGKERMKGRNEKGRKGRKEKIVLILLIFKLRFLFSSVLKGICICKIVNCSWEEVVFVVVCLILYREKICIVVCMSSALLE